MSRVAVFLAEGFEEVEAVTPIDYLRRAGVDVVTVGVSGPVVCGARGISLNTDMGLEEFRELPGGIVLPGGMPGAANLAASSRVEEIVRDAMERNLPVGAICAAPVVVLAGFGLLEGRTFTCYPGFQEQVSGARFLEDRVVVDANLVTSRGAGTAGEFATALIRILVDSQSAGKVAQAVLLDPQH